MKSASRITSYNVCYTKLLRIYPGEKYSGEIIRKYPTIDAYTHSFQIEIRINNPGEKLRPGMFARVSLELGEMDALVVPALAVLVITSYSIHYTKLYEVSTALSTRSSENSPATG